MCDEWRAHIVKWFKTPPEELNDQEATIVGDILQIIATQRGLNSLLTSPLLAIVCLLRVVGHFPFNVAEFDVDAEPDIVHRAFWRIASVNAPLRVYRSVMLASKEKTPDALLGAIKALHHHGLCAEATDMLTLSHPGISDEEKSFMSTAFRLLNFDVAEITAADALNNLRATTSETRRILIQRAMDKWESEPASLTSHDQALASFIRWVVKRPDPTDDGPSPNSMIKACALLVDSSDITHDDVLHLVSRVVATEAGVKEEEEELIVGEVMEHPSELTEEMDGEGSMVGEAMEHHAELTEEMDEEGSIAGEAMAHHSELTEEMDGDEAIATHENENRADWRNAEYEVWFQAHRDTWKKYRRDKVVADWQRMAEKMNETFGTSFIGTQLKNHYNHSKENIPPADQVPTDAQ